ncbi:acyltransferase [Leptolyngbya sp. FACHB-261]|uniref:acyltransferase n=1 Tax=Leptolyngbya sp. FACHB-261 TaxID=2692806 RepID=UPI001684394A|nr:acyltransferase [Leptolyngbya sp. FACHB-261]MBD2103244.1 acyltransferase [Leptolyngbya sp. FACHB-261]
MSIDLFSPAKWFRWPELVLVALVGWVPYFPGKTLRRLLYRLIFRQLGTAVQIQPGFEFVRADRIEVGHGTRIDQQVRIKNVGPNSKIKLGNRVHLDRGIDIKAHPGLDDYIEIGENTYIGPYTCISGRYIKIGRDCLIASHSSIYANNHNFSDRDRIIKEQGSNYRGIVIEDDCWLGSGVRVLDGVTIGRGSVIGAGAVVTKSIAPYSVAVGVPAKVISKREEMQVCQS